MDVRILSRTYYIVCAPGRFIRIPADKHDLVISTGCELMGNSVPDGSAGSSDYGNATMAFVGSVHLP
jgi:hypothetical protein